MSAICPVCGVDPTDRRIHVDESGEAYTVSGHDCHCVRVDRLRVAVGICCGRDLGAALLAEEDYHAGAPWSEDRDCTCPKPGAP